MKDPNTHRRVRACWSLLLRVGPLSSSGSQRHSAASLSPPQGYWACKEPAAVGTTTVMLAKGTLVPGKETQCLQAWARIPWGLKSSQLRITSIHTEEITGTHLGRGFKGLCTGKVPVKQKSMSPLSDICPFGGLDTVFGIIIL